MKLNKKMIAVAAGALSVAAVTPAMAFENEFHGMFQVQGIASNLLNGTTGPVDVNQGNLHKNKTYVDQRARIQYVAKASDDLKLVTHFEIDSRWGDSSYTVARNQGGAVGADQINLETKNVYLDFNVPGAPVNAKVGIQGWSDAYKGIFFANDAAGVVTTTKVGDGKVGLGFFRFDDARGAGQDVGKQTRDFLFLDGVFNVSKDVKVGASYYFYNDDFSIPTSAVTTYAGGPTNAAIHMLGVNGSAAMGALTVDGFVLYQNGVIQKTPSAKFHQSAFAANLAAKVKAGVGTVKASALYASGNNNGVGGNSFITAQNETSAAYMESGVFSDANTVLLFRGNNYRTSNTDQSIVSEAGNKGAGFAALFLGYDGAMGKTFFNVNAAAAADAKKQSTGKAQYIGTEFNAEVGYKLYDNLKASVQGGYVVLGPKYQGSDVPSGTTYNNSDKYANNPYLGRVVLSYNF